jgi:hypothetical protein
MNILAEYLRRNDNEGCGGNQTCAKKASPRAMHGIPEPQMEKRTPSASSNRRRMGPAQKKRGCAKNREEQAEAGSKKALQLGHFPESGSCQQKQRGGAGRSGNNQKPPHLAFLSRIGFQGAGQQHAGRALTQRAQSPCKRTQRYEYAACCAHPNLLPGNAEGDALGAHGIGPPCSQSENHQPSVSDEARMPSRLPVVDRMAPSKNRLRRSSRSEKPAARSNADFAYALLDQKFEKRAARRMADTIRKKLK